MDEAAAQADASATHTRIAERMRDLALANGGIYGACTVTAVAPASAS
jgi:hypothetical protein